MVELPKLNKQEQEFAENLIKGLQPKKAYELAYNCENMKPRSISAEAQKKKKSPKIQQYILYAAQHKQEVIQKKWQYDADKAMAEYEEVRNLAFYKVHTKDGVQALNTMIKAIDGKVKVSGVALDKEETNVNVGIQVPSIQVNGKDVEFVIGSRQEETIDSETSSE